MNQNVSTELLDRKEAAGYLRICKNTLDKLSIPRIKVRRRVIYRRLDLDRWLTENIQIKGV